MTQSIIAHIYKDRLTNNVLPIAKNKDNTYISAKDKKLNRPYLVIFSNKKVYYLSIKTINKYNRFATFKDITNVNIRDKNIYGQSGVLGNSINCSVINIMDKQMFLDLYDLSSNLNNVKVNDKIYQKVMLKVNKNLISNNVWFSQVIGFENNQTQFLWENEIDINIKKEIIDFIKIYKEIWDSNFISLDKLKVLNLTKEEINELKEHFIKLGYSK
ncbi:Hypothetical protein MALK_0010 [Metamycoplasma alkalescens 14918]|uniref:Uncharacterized protein n=1 Tax=Metamycoplasma alkalescens 14918 TaxID=1188234 RepID=N9SRZ1_9BACT|nr:Hypothetical protein MALK_0010 [Metamycoplasma alkalescens 14918]